MNDSCTALPSTLGIIAEEMKVVAARHREGGKENAIERSLSRIAEALARLADTFVQLPVEQAMPTGTQHCDV